MSIDGRLPVVIGVGQITNKDAERIVHPAELMADAVRSAVDDAQTAGLLDHVSVIRSAPLSVFGEDHGGEMVAELLNMPPGERLQWAYSGAAPQRHLTAACEQISRGEIDAVLLVGGIADASFRNAGRRGLPAPAPPTASWSQGSSGVGDLRPTGRYNWVAAERDAGGDLPSSYFALVESVIGSRLGLTPDQHRARLGVLLAGFTEVAAGHPDRAWFPVARTPSELSTATTDNRFIAEPYTKLMCSFPTADLAAAVIVVSTELADRLHVPPSKRVHPWVGVGAKEFGPPSIRPTIDAAGSLDQAVAIALTLSGISADDIGAFDFYSCFPAAIQLGMRAFGVGVGDPRPKTVTGGLPFFGGPGANYTLHGIASLVEFCREHDGSVGAMVGLGGMVDDFSVGLYSTASPSHGFQSDNVVDDGSAAVPIARSASGPGVIEASTVLHDRDQGPYAVPAIVRLPDGRRVGARIADDLGAAQLSGQSLIGRSVALSDNEGVTTYDL